MVHRSMALLTSSALAVEGRSEKTLDEHEAIVDAISKHDGASANEALKNHLSVAFETRLKIDAGEV